MSLTTPYSDSFQVADGVTTKFFFNEKFEPISKNYVKCEVYNEDGSVIVPDFEPVLEEGAIKIVALTQPDGTVLNAPREGSIVRIYRDVPEAQNTTAQALQASTAQQIVQNFDNIVAMIQELQYANEHFTLRSTLPQRDLQIDLLRDIDDQKLVYWDNEKRKLVVTNYRQDELLLPADKEDILEQANAYSDEQNAVLESRINGKLTAVDAQIDANADAIQKTREDYIAADSEIHQILNNHASELTTLRGNQASLGDQVSGIEEKIPGDASATNQLATKADLKDINLDGYVKKSGDTMTGDLAFDVVAGGYTVVFQDSYKNVNTGNTDSVIKRITSTHQTQGLIFSEHKNGTVNMQFSMIADGFFMPHGNRLLGSVDYPWNNIYAKKLNNGADIAIPTEGGTLARIEDLIDLRADINEADSELQTQITAQAAEIATKQDQLVAGDNIVISGNTISATGAGGGVGFDMQVVDQLPATGKKGVIYLVPKDGSAPDVHDEYVWIDATQTFELIGTTQVDLTDYATKEELGGYLPTTGGALTGDLSLDNHKLNFKGGVSVLGNGNIGGIWVSYYNNKIAISAYTRTLSGIQKLNNGADIAIPTTGGTLARLEDITDINNNSINTKDLTVGTSEGTLNLSITAGVATIATNNGLDIVSQTKFDTAPTTDDNTTYANALDTSLVRKAQVATAISDVLTSVEGELAGIVEYVDKEDLAIKNDQTQLNKNINTVADWVNAKDSEGNRATLETEAQDAYRAINELNAKIGTGAGTKVIIKRYS